MTFGALQTIVVVGASMAGLRTAEALRSEGFTGSLVIVGEESHAPYDRPPLSKELLTGKKQQADIGLHFADQIGADWRPGSAAVALDTSTGVLTVDDDREVRFDGLVLATGSRPRRLAGFTPDGESVFELRTLDDSLRLRAQLSPGRRLLIVGCGFIGIEVASSARERGVQVSLVSNGVPLAVAGPLVTAAVTRMLNTADVDLHLARTVASRTATSDGQLVVLDDGSELIVDTILVAVGAVPRIDWLAGSGIPLDNGVICDATLHASPDIVAAGDVANWPNPAFGGLAMRIEHWTNAIEQGRAAAQSLLAGADASPFASVPSFWSDHFGVRLQSIGVLALADEFTVTDGDPEQGRFAASAYQNGQLVGGVSYAMPRPLLKLRNALIRPCNAA